MSHIKEVNVFTNGDSKNIATWSNIPYFLCETLLSEGIKVNRIDLSPNKILHKYFNKTILRLIILLNKNSTYEYFRSIYHFIDIKLRIKREVNKYPNSEINIFLTFTFSSFGLKQKPAIQICDWTY